MTVTTTKLATAAICLVILAACGNKEAQLQARCSSEGNATYTQAMAGVKLATDEGSIANKLAKAAAEQAQAYTFSECMKRG